MKGGYAGKILMVDLTNSRISTLNTSDYTDYIGGRGIALKLQWDYGNPKVENGLDPDALLMFVPGVLGGTPAMGSARTVVCFKQVSNRPNKCYFSHASFGGHWGPELKFAGYDGVCIRGKAPKPVYLWIDDDNVEIRDAARLWLADTYTTDRTIRAACGGDPQVRIAKIGPAGANLCGTSNILVDHCHSASLYPGAAMGAKNLKAVAVRGTGGVKVADWQALMAERQRYTDVLNEGPRNMGFKTQADFTHTTYYPMFPNLKRVQGCRDCGWGCYFYTEHDNPAMPKGGNYCTAYTAYIEALAIANGLVELKKTAYGDYYGEPAAPKSLYVNPTVNLFGKTADAMGVSVFEALGIKGFNSFVNHLIFNEDFGPKMKAFIENEVGAPYGSEAFAREYPRKCAHREGKFCSLMGDGAHVVAGYMRDNPEEFGLTKKQGKWVWDRYTSVYPKDNFFSHHFYRPNLSFSGKPGASLIQQAPMMAGIWALGTRDMSTGSHSCYLIYDDKGPIHGNSRGHALKAFGTEEGAARYLDANGNPILADQLGQKEGDWYTYDGRKSSPKRVNFTKGTPQVIKYALSYHMQNDMLPLCDQIGPLIAGSIMLTHVPPVTVTKKFASDPDNITLPEMASKFYSAVTGMKKTYEKLMEDGLRCVTLDRAIHVRDNDRTRADDTVSEHFFNRPDRNGIAVDKEEFARGMTMTYEQLGWDPKTGRPTRKTLEKYGMQDVADKLKAMGRLPG